MTDDATSRYSEALRLGHLAVARGDPREAIGCYEEAGRLAEHRPLAFVAMGSVYLQMHQPREAIAAFDEALRRAPGDLAALRGKASALEVSGRPEEAAALRRRASELEALECAGRPAGAQADERHRALEQHIAHGCAARAAGDLDRAVAAFHAAALGYAEEDRLEAALDACLRALEARPGAIDVHFTMAHLYLRRGWADRAVERVLLIDRRLHIDADPRRRAALLALARDYQALAPELRQLVASAS